MMNEMDEEDEEQYYDDAMFEEEGPTAVELAQRIIKELESNQTISLDELKEKIEVMETNVQLNVNYVDGVDVLPDNHRDGKTLASQYEWNKSTTIPYAKTERDDSIINLPPSFDDEDIHDDGRSINDTYNELINKSSGNSNTSLTWNKSTLINNQNGSNGGLIEGSNNINSPESVIAISESQRLPFQPNTNEGLVSAKVNYGRVLKVSPPKYISSNRYSPRPQQRGRRIVRPKTSGHVESIVRRQIRTTPVMIRVNNNNNTKKKKKRRGKSARRSSRKKTPLVKSIMASNRIYVGSSKVDRAKYNNLKYKKAHRFDKYNHDGFIYYSKKNLTT